MPWDLAVSDPSGLSVPALFSVHTVDRMPVFSVEIGADLDFGAGAPFGAGLSYVLGTDIFVGTEAPLGTFFIGSGAEGLCVEASIQSVQSLYFGPKVFSGCFMSCAFV